MSFDSEDFDFERVLPIIYNDDDRHHKLMETYKKKNEKCAQDIESLYAKLKIIKMKKSAIMRKNDEKKSSLNYYKPIIQSQREAGQEIEKCCIILNKEIQNEDGKYMEKIQSHQNNMTELQERFIGFSKLYGFEQLRHEINVMSEEVNNSRNEKEEMERQLASDQQIYFLPANTDDMEKVNIVVDELKESEKIVEKLTTVKNDIVQKKTKLTQELLQAKVLKNSLEEELKHENWIY